MFPLILQLPGAPSAVRGASRRERDRRSPRRQSQGGTNSPRHIPLRGAPADDSSVHIRPRIPRVRQRPALTDQPRNFVRPPCRHTATMRPYRSRSRSLQATVRPPICPACARVARFPQSQRSPPARQLCLLSGASIPCRRPRTVPTSIVSPSITHARPYRSGSNATVLPLPSPPHGPEVRSRLDAHGKRRGLQRRRPPAMRAAVRHVTTVVPKRPPACTPYDELLHLRHSTLRCSGPGAWRRPAIPSTAPAGLRPPCCPPHPNPALYRGRHARGARRPGARKANRARAKGNAQHWLPHGPLTCRPR